MARKPTAKPSARIVRGETRDPAKLHAYPNNARKHPKAQLAQIRASVLEFGFTIPVLIDEKDMIIAGHGRVMVALELKLTEVPVIIAIGWTEAQKRAYVIADNRHAETGIWDEKLLAQELGELQSIGFSLEPIGFELRDVAKLMEGPKPRQDWGALGKSVVKYEIIFDDDDQQKDWFAFLRQLKRDYPTQETIGSRIAAYIKAHHGAVA